MAQGSTINWLVETVGDAHTMSRKDILAASHAAPVQTQTISRYLTTADHLGHVEGNWFNYHGPKGSRWDGGSSRIPYFRRVKRGVYTLTEIGWMRYREICMAKKRADVRDHWSKSETIVALEAYGGRKVETIVAEPLSAEAFLGLPQILRAADSSGIISAEDVAKSFESLKATHIRWDSHPEDVLNEDLIIYCTDGEIPTGDAIRALMYIISGDKCKEDDTPDHYDCGLL